MHSVHDRFHHLSWTNKGKDKGKGDDPARAYNQYGEVIGYTLDEEVLDQLAGNKKHGFGWMWEAGNYLMTHDGKIYLFL